MKLLMVCLGNICRSPLAEGIMQDKIVTEGLDWTVDSAGTGAWHVGEQADPRSRATARRHGLNIDHQRARKFVASDFERFDLIFAMDQSNYQNIRKLSNDSAQLKKVHLILDFAHGQLADVPDPYWDDNGFEQVYELLEGACGAVLSKLHADHLSS
jgi:protein-tyrosine phosphatase